MIRALYIGGGLGGLACAAVSTSALRKALRARRSGATASGNVWALYWSHVVGLFGASASFLLLGGVLLWRWADFLGVGIMIATGLLDFWCRRRERRSVPSLAAEGS